MCQRDTTRPCLSPCCGRRCRWEDPDFPDQFPPTHNTHKNCCPKNCCEGWSGYHLCYNSPIPPRKAAPVCRMTLQRSPYEMGKPRSFRKGHGGSGKRTFVYFQSSVHQPFLEILFHRRTARSPCRIAPPLLTPPSSLSSTRRAHFPRPAGRTLQFEHWSLVPRSRSHCATLSPVRDRHGYGGHGGHGGRGGRARLSRGGARGSRFRRGVRLVPGRPKHPGDVRTKRVRKSSRKFNCLFWICGTGIKCGGPLRHRRVLGGPIPWTMYSPPSPATCPLPY